MDVELRPRFYEGQYLGAADLSSIVAYLRTAQARHALGGHTWGIAIGLQLTERSAPGGQDRVEVTLQPGFGWDGYGRPILNPRPTRLNEDLFAAIPYHPILDDVANGGFGRVVEVWLQYTETASGNPAPGFETCATDDQHARITESFRFETGQQAESRQRDKVTIGTSSVDAKQALTTFGSTDVLHDTSVPHQQFALDEKPRRWLIPVGYVRWIARDQALGYFAKGELDPAHPTAPRTRAFRRYVGSVAEYIEAADGAIVLHKRSTDPKSPHFLSTLLDNATTPAEVTALLDDLVWVEGNLRVVGQAKLCRELLFRNRNGVDENTTLYMARRGDNPPVPGDGNRELHIVIGPDSQTTNRLVVGPEVPPAGVSTQPTTAPHLVVVSSGDVGIGTHDPTARLNIVGNRVRLQDNSAAAKRLELRVDGDGVGMESPTDSITLRSFGAFGKNKVLINPDANDGQVGIRVQSPQHDVDAKGRSIKLGMEVDGGGQLVLSHDAADNVVLEGRNAAGTGSAAELRIAGRNSNSLSLLKALADTVDVGAKLIKLGLEGNGGGQLILACNQNDNRIFLEGFSRDGTGHADEILITGRNSDPVPRVSVIANTVSLTGNVGIGTAFPQQKLHVAGDFILVDGRANEQAYIGGDGAANDVQVGSLNNGIQRVVLYNPTSNTRMELVCGDIECGDIDPDSIWGISDAEYKQDVATVRNALDTISRLRGVRFRWKPGRAGANEEAIGVIAQEVRAVLPEAVKDRPKGASVNYFSLIPVLIEAVKELKGEVDALREVQQLKTASKPKAARTRKKKTEHPS